MSSEMTTCSIFYSRLSREDNISLNPGLTESKTIQNSKKLQEIAEEYGFPVLFSSLPPVFPVFASVLSPISEAHVKISPRHVPVDPMKAATDHGDDHLRLRVENPGLDPEMNVFFHHNDLVMGNRILIYFPRKYPSASPRFLSREESDSIPFSTSQFPKLLEFFSFTSDSKQAKAMKMTLHHCEAKPIKGETKICATSLESLLDFVHSVFGPGLKFQVLNTDYLNESISTLQNYTVHEDPSVIPSSELVSCHRLPYPYAVFYCHAQVGDNVVYKALMEGDDGGRVEAAAICHMDTSEWDPKHAGFRVLKTRPGADPVCHFFPVDSLVFIPM